MENLTDRLLTFSFIFVVITFVFSYTVDVYAVNNFSSNCEWCNSGKCTEQTSGTGWTKCIDASPGGEQCALGGSSCCVGSLCEN